MIKTGKKARVINADDIPKKYNYLFEDMPQYDFKENYIVAVDIATENLLGGYIPARKQDPCRLFLQFQFRPLH